MEVDGDVDEFDRAVRASWTELLANALRAGEPSARLRSYVKEAVHEDVNWLKHAKNAMRMDAEIGLKRLEFLIGLFTAAILRLAQPPTDCEDCQSYAEPGGVCCHCGWEKPGYVPPSVREWTEHERAVRLAESCTPTSDISRFMSPFDLVRPEDA